MNRSTPTGIGLGLRTSLLTEIQQGCADHEVAFLEVAPENYMRRGGPLPARLSSLVERFPLVSHGLMMSLGSTDPLDRDYLATLAHFTRMYRPQWHSDHLCWSGLGGTLMHDLLPLPFRHDTILRVADKLRFAQDALNVPMAIENISWYFQVGYPHYAETDFIAEILERSGCSLVLDVNNVFVNATNHGFDPLAWLAEIPLERVIQLHIAGHEVQEDGLIIDTHGDDVRTEVEDLLRWVITRKGPCPVLLERDANIPPLTVLLEEVARLNRVYQDGLAAWECDHERSP